MNQEEILLKDLCSRLPYGVMVKDRNGVHKLTAGNTEFIDLLYNGKCNIRPYLFPLSSMTEEQKEEWRCIRWSKPPWEELDWLNKGKWDYRHLIEKSLALDATGLNIY